MADSQTKLKNLLRELFQLDSADLDFGIYRIMNSKRSEIERFLDNDLLPQIKEAFLQYESSDSAQVKADLDKVIQQLKDAGVDPELSPKVKEFREKLLTAIDISALENQVFSDLFNFFRRYYNEGDFLSLRRYKEGVYAIPYEGEEVKLYWANHDQYYIKTSEYLRDYAFRVSDGRRVHFRLAAADIDKDNNKAANGKDRRFILAGEDATAEENGELVVRFELRPDAEKRRQDALNAQATTTIVEAPAAAAWLFALAALNPSEADPNRTVLAKHLKDYTARNTFDYFIHKDVGPFLRRELDFFIKNEVMHLDDIESASVPRVEQYLSGIKVLRRIAHKIIDFVAQLENFQKKLWLKKKFVVETRYCITLGVIPQDFYADIAANDAQRAEWIALYAIDQIKADLTQPGYSAPLSAVFLGAHPTLVLDTRHFSPEFTARLLERFANLTEDVDGLLVHSENFQGLRHLQSRYRSQIDVVYIDPPYNTDASAILYKNDYKHSTWLSLIENRLTEALRLMTDAGVMCVAIDDEEVSKAREVLGQFFRKEIGVAVVRSNPQSRKAKGKFSPVHEYALFYGKTTDATPGSLELTEKRIARYPKQDENGRFAWMNLIRTGTNDKRSDRPKLYYPIFVAEDDKLRVPKMTWSKEIGEHGEYVLQEATKPNEVMVFPNVESNGGVIEKNWHRGHNRISSEQDEYRVRRDAGGKINIDFKTRMDEDSTPVTWWDNNEYASANYGAAELKGLFGAKPFDFPKAVTLVADCLRAANADVESLILDYFAGSGTTSHAVINLNREDAGHRKFILIEGGEHFETVIVPRIKKVVFTPEWSDGKPVRPSNQEEADRSPRIIKILRLESYEDALNNLDLIRSELQQSLLDANHDVREDYTLRYMLDVESKDSQSLLNIQAFADPFKYTLNIATNTVGETKRTNVDLVETFNWLLGLRVKHLDTIRGFRIVHGTNQDGEKVLVIWRNVEENPNAKLDEFFQKQGYNTKDMEFDLIYVNGDNNLENLKKDEDTWKVRLIEEEFGRLMFDVQDV
jgi:adenine-specific DNA-methyltransferase